VVNTDLALLTNLGAQNPGKVLGMAAYKRGAICLRVVLICNPAAPGHAQL
jgi:hypothetical protein